MFKNKKNTIMKIFKSLVIFAALLCCLAARAQRVKLNEAQKKAQTVIMTSLRAINYSPTIDTNDQSVCFKKGDLLYWITFEGKSSPLLYTIHHKPIKFSLDNGNDLSRRREVAEKAANMVNSRLTVKASMTGSRVNLSFPMYAASPEDFTRVLPACLDAFSSVRKEFDECYKIARVKTDSIHDYWTNVDTMTVVVPQKNVAEAASQRNLTISSISVRVVDDGNNVISDYDKGIRRKNCRYLQESIEMTAKNDGVYKVGVRLYTPEGKLLVPDKAARFTTVTTVDVRRANKMATYELLKFGSDDDQMWKAGEYKIEFYEDDNKIFTDAINIL